MANIKLGIYNGEPDRVDKSNKINWTFNQTAVELANGSNLENVTILLDNIPDYKSINYMQVDNAYYFVEPIKYGFNGLYEIIGNIDELMSYKDTIKSIECIIERSSNLSNAYLRDNDYIISTKTKTITKSFPSGLTEDSIILMTVG